MVAMVTQYHLKFCQTTLDFQTTLYLSTGKFYHFSSKLVILFTFKEKMSILCHFFKKKNSAETCSTQKKNNTAEQGLSQASNTGKPSTF